MAHTKQDLIDSIKEMKSVYNDADTPQSVKDSIKPSLEKAEKLLHDLEKAETPAATPEEKKEKPTAKEIVKATHAGEKKVKKATEKKQPAKKEKAPHKARVVKMSTSQKKTLQQIVASAKKYAGYAGKSEGDLRRDASRKAKKPGSRVSSTGHTYREYRANRSDVNTGAPHLGKGGEITYADGRPIRFSLYGSNGEYYIKDNDSDRTLPSSTVKYWTGSMNQFASKPKARKALITMLKKMHKEQPAYNPDIKYAAGGPIGEGKNGYIAFYKCLQLEVMADSSYQAQQKAVAHFKAKKSYDVTVVLAELEGKQVTHRPDFARGGRTRSRGSDVKKYLYKKMEEQGVDVDYFKRKVAQLKMDLHEGSVGEEDYDGWTTTKDKVESMISDLPSTVYYDHESGSISESEPEGGYEDEETGEFIEDHGEWHEINVADELLGEVAEYRKQGGMMNSGGETGKPVIKVKPTQPYGGLYSDPNDDKYFKDAKGNIYMQYSGKDTFYACTPEGEPEYPISKSEVVVVDQFARGGALASNQIEFGSYKTTSLTAEGKAAFEKAIADLEREDKEGVHYKNAHQAMGILLRMVDNVLTSSVPKNVHIMLQSVGIYNYKTGLLLDTYWLTDELETRKLQRGGGFNQYGEPYGFPDPEDDDYGEEPEDDDFYQDEDLGGTGHGDISYSDADPGLARGGRIKSAINRDRKYRSDEPWEQSYKRKTRPSNPRYKHAKGGMAGLGKKFLFKDHSGRGIKEHLDENHIRSKWDLNETGSKGEKLEDFLDHCSDGDTWNNEDGTTELICIGVDYSEADTTALFKSKVFKLKSGPHAGSWALETKTGYIQRYDTEKKAKDAFDSEYGKKHKKGGRLKSAINRDRKYKSDEPWEKSYKRRTSPKNPRYAKKAGGGKMQSKMNSSLARKIARQVGKKK